MPDFGPDFLLYWAIAALVVGFVSSVRGRGWALGFWSSLLLSPIIGLIIVLATGDGQARSPCPECKESVIVGAARCPHCRTELEWPEPTS
jgi:hypothetical protein